MCCAILRLMSVGEPATGPRAMRDSEGIQAPKSLGPPAPARIEDKQAKGGPSLSNQGSRVLESALPGFHLVEDIGNRGRSRREVRGAEQRGNREVPGFSGAAHAPGNPDTGRATTSSRRRGMCRRMVGVEGRTTRIGGVSGGEGDQASQAQERPS